jgi:hypothetical protein
MNLVNIIVCCWSAKGAYKAVNLCMTQDAYLLAANEGFFANPRRHRVISWTIVDLQ